MKVIKELNSLGNKDKITGPKHLTHANFSTDLGLLYEGHQRSPLSW